MPACSLEVVLAYQYEKICPGIEREKLLLTTQYDALILEGKNITHHKAGKVGEMITITNSDISS